jgi:hypothetical protein
MIPDERVPLSSNDTILRQLPSGIIEKMIITNPGFIHEALGVKGHYQAKYRTAGEGSPTTPGYIFHVTGPNSRVNINSTDNSVNSVSGIENNMQLAEEFSRLREALLTSANDASHYAAIGAISQAEIAAKDNNKEKMASALPAIGNAAKWVLDTAKEIAVPIAQAAIKAACGMPPA